MNHLIRRALTAHQDRAARKFFNGKPEAHPATAQQEEDDLPGAVLYLPNTDGTPGGHWINQH